MSTGPAPCEPSDTALTGYKIAYTMISADGARTGFCGVGAGRDHVYQAVDKAVCLNNSRHPVPHRMCKCGFYCFHTVEAARDLTCVPENRDVVVLEIAASGRYRRHERGSRYEHQRVRSVLVGRCRCSRPADRFVDSGTGRLGWRRLTPCCNDCAQNMPVLTLERFAALTGRTDITVRTDEKPLGNFDLPSRGRFNEPTHEASAVVDAEFAVINARIDGLQAEVEQLLHKR